MAKKFYITTPLYYVNASPHIGHSYTNIAADTIARFYRLLGYEVFLLTGTDEHGEKIEEASIASGNPKGQEKRFVDRMVPVFKDLWRVLRIDYSRFIRTTDQDHKFVVQRFFERLREKGDIYKAKYEGWFCTPCETFWTKMQIGNEDLCPDCKRTLTWIEEENYFFRLSKYQNWLIDYIKANPDFIRPFTRANEILGFLREPLSDLCISRPKTRLEWGIELPFDKDYVSYVWFDALINYVTGCGFLTDEERFKTLWPADIHLVGKDILRHHTVYWPAMLYAMGLQLPKTIFAHGWWKVKGQKMSKSKGNIVNPLDVIAEYGVDAYRYFLLREVTFGLDGVFSEEALKSRYNSDLANDLGNLLNRSLTMVVKYLGGKAPQGCAWSRLPDLVNELKGKVRDAFSEVNFNLALVSIWEVVNSANKFIEEKEPWRLSRDGREKELREVLYLLLETLRFLAVFIYPFMPDAAKRMWSQLGFESDLADIRFDGLKWGEFPQGQNIRKQSPLFPRK